MHISLVSKFIIGTLSSQLSPKGQFASLHNKKASHRQISATGFFNDWRLLRSVRKQCDLTGAFDRNRQETLILRACSCHATWQNFAPLADEFLKQFSIFIVNVSNFVHSEETYFTTFVAAAAACRSFVVSAFSLLEAHAIQSFLY